MEIPQIYNRREAEQQREKWGWKGQLQRGPAMEIAERQRKAVRELPQGLLKKHC